MTGGIYIHVPFCSSFCTYCDFYSVTDTGLYDRYFEALGIEAEARTGKYFNINKCPATIYIGGGTPSLINTDKYRRLLETISMTTPLSGIREFTIEANPDDVSREYIDSLKETGVNRVSMGIQSFHDEDLKWMNRRHNAKTALHAFDTLRKCGIENISLDLIFGYGSLSHEKWMYNLKLITDLRPEHISAYQMSIEDGSALGKLFRTGKYVPPDDSFCERQYRILQEYLASKGYIQYEISNFSLPGKKAIHNSSYWEHTGYLGLGAAAHSFDGIRKREWGPCDINAYISEVTSGKYIPEGEILDDKELFNETLMVGLRRTEGVNLENLKTISGKYFGQFAAKLERKIRLHPHLAHENGILRIKPEGFFVSDNIISDLFI